jgi:hypothetical protein
MRAAEVAMFTLLFGSTEMGEVTQTFFSDENWYGVLTLGLSPESKLGLRIAEYASFCQEWSEREKKDAAEPAEFENYADLVHSKDWLLRDNDNGVTHEVGCPFFFGGGEFSCRTRKWIDST